MKVGTESPAARRANLEREKRELRLERDRLLLDLARNLGTDDLARSFGTSAATAEQLVQRASRRLSGAEGISARRIARDPDRWREIDRYYESLGRSARLPGSRRRGR